MTCLKEENDKERGGAVQCEEEGCKFRPIPIEINREFDGYPSPDDCVLQLRLRARDINDSPTSIEEFEQ